MVRMAQSAKDEPLRFVKVCDTRGDLVMIVFHGAAWAKAVLDPEDEFEEFQVRSGQGVYSQLGSIIFMTNRAALEGKEAPTSIMG